MAEHQKKKMDHQTLSQYLSEKACERAERYDTRQTERWPLLSGVDTLAFLGNFSWTMPLIHQRWLWKPSIVDIGNGPQTPTEIMRDYLDYRYPTRLRCTTEQYHAIMQARSFPRMAQRGEYPHMMYVDLKSAYWSIINAVGWDVDYHPGRWLGVKGSMDDFPLKGHKAARSSIVTAGLSSPIRYWTGSELRWKTGSNKHINYGLWALVQDVLHGIASDMLRIGAVYVHTDGYIIPDNRWSDAQDIANTWGLKVGIKAQGPTKVWGIGVYSVGGTRTKRERVIPVQDHVHVAPHDKDWLQRKFSFWSARVGTCK